MVSRRYIYGIAWENVLTFSDLKITIENIRLQRNLEKYDRGWRDTKCDNDPKVQTNQDLSTNARHANSF